MWEGHVNDKWQHTAEILSVLYNANRDPQKHPSPFKTEDFHPIARAIARARRRASGAGWGKLMKGLGAMADQNEFEG